MASTVPLIIFSLWGEQEEGKKGRKEFFPFRVGWKRKEEEKGGGKENPEVPFYKK